MGSCIILYQSDILLQQQSYHQKYLTGCSENPSKIRFYNDFNFIIKKSRTSEHNEKYDLDEKQKQFFNGLKKFVPKYYGSTKEDYFSERYFIKMENLLQNTLSRNQNKALYPSYLDLKLGTSCVKLDPSHHNFKYFKSLDEQTTTQKYGFRLTGYCLYENNQVQEYICEQNYITDTYEKVKHIFTQMFYSPIQQPIELKYIDYLINWIQSFIEFLSDCNIVTIKGSSLFFIFSRDYYMLNQKYSQEIKIVDVRFIDFTHMEQKSEVNQLDESGLIFGLSNVVKLLLEIKNDINQIQENKK